MSSFDFSRRTVLAALDELEVLTQGQFSRFLLELGPLSFTVRDESVSLRKRLNSLMEVVDAVPAHQIDGGGLLRDAIVKKAVSLLVPADRPLPWKDAPSVPPPKLFAFLEVDGFRVVDGKLLRTLPAEFKVPEAESQLVSLLAKHQLDVANGHLNNCLAAHGRGEWAGANGQLRSFFDALLDELAVRLDPTAGSLGSGQARRTRLAKLGFLSRDLNEWDDQGLGFINGLVKRLHPHGAHPGLSDQEDSTFRLHVVLLTARMLLVRFDARSMP